MSSVDNRIVNMQFNNKQFTSGAAESQKSLQALEKTIATTGKSQGLNELGKSVDGMKVKFGAMQIAGTAALGTIVSKATMGGLNFLKSFTLDPISAGFKEYQTGLNSVQTIIANTGESTKNVDKALKRLNEYSDQTIYNFGEMARNIGTFTAAGVQLKPAVSAIKGIANLAALSGSNSQQASSAMYQLSQAIAAGRVNLQDWNSVVNAGMGGKQFQTALTRTAGAMGTLDKKTIQLDKSMKVAKIAGMSFRDSISAKGGQPPWLTSDVLVSTLATLDGRFSASAFAAQKNSEGLRKFSDKAIEAKIATARLNLEKQKGIKFSDEEFKAVRKMADASSDAATKIKSFPQLVGVVQESIGSMWSTVFKGVLGNFDQSVNLWTKVGDVTQKILGDVDRSFTGMVTSWATEPIWAGDMLGGRKRFKNSLGRLFSSIGSILAQVKGAFNDVFPSNSTKTLLTLTKHFRNLTVALKPGEETLKNLRNIFGGIFAVMHIGTTIIKALGSLFFNFIGGLTSGAEEAGGGILSMLGALGNVLKAVDKAVTSGDVLVNVFGNVGKIAGLALSPLVKVIGLLIKSLGALANGGVDGFLAVFNQARVLFLQFSKAVVNGLVVITTPFGKLNEFFIGLRNNIGHLIAKFSFVQGSLDSAASSSEGLAEKFKKLIANFKGFGSIGDGIGKTADQLKAKVSSLGGVFDKFGGSSDKSKSSIAETAKGMVAATASSDKVASGFAAVATSTTGATTAVNAMYATLSTPMAAKATEATEGLGAAAEESGSTWQTIGGAISAIVQGLGAGLGRLTEFLGNAAAGFGDLFKDTDALGWASFMNAIFTGAVLLSIKSFLESLNNGVTFIGEAKTAIMDSVQAMTDTFGELQNTLKAKALQAIAIAIAILVASIVVLSFVKMPALMKGLSAIGIMMGLLVGSLTALSKIESDKEIAFLAGSIGLIAAAMVSLALAVTILGNQDQDKIYKGIGAMAAIMGVLVGSLLAFAAVQKKMDGDIKGMAGSILIIAFAMNILVTAVLALGLIPFDVLRQGIGAVALIMGIFALTLGLLAKEGEHAVAAGAGILLVAIAINILAGALAFLGSLDMKTLWKGGIAIAAMLVAITLTLDALSIMGPEVKIAAVAIIIVAGAIMILAMALEKIGSISWDDLKKGGVVIGAFLIAILGIAALITAFPPLLIALIGFAAAVALLGAAMLMAGIGMALFGAGFAVLVATGSAGVALLTTAFQAFMAMLPSFAMQIAAAVVTFIQTIANASGKLRIAFGKIVEAILGVLEDAIQPLGDIVTELIDVMLGIFTDAVPDVGRLISAIIEEAIRVIRDSAVAWGEAIIYVIDHLLAAINEHMPSIIESASEILQTFLRELGEEVPEIADTALTMVENILSGLATAIDNHTEGIRDAGLQLARAILNAMTGGLLNEGAAMIGDAINTLLRGIPAPVRKFLGLPSGKGGSGGGGGGGGGGGSARIAVPAAAVDPRGAPPSGGGFAPRVSATGADPFGKKGAAAAKPKPEVTFTSLVADWSNVITKALGKGGRELMVGVERSVLQGIMAGNALAVKNFSAALMGIQSVNRKLQLEADTAQSKADVFSGLADRSKGKKKEKFTRLSEKAQNAADAAQARADAKNDEFQRELNVQEADFQGQGDIRSEQAQEEADQAAKMLALANAEAAQAKKFKANSKEAKRLRELARKHAEEAARLAREAEKHRTEANDLYEKGVLEDIQAFKEQLAQEQAAKDFQTKFDAADNAGKAAMLDARAIEFEGKAADATTKMNTALADAERLASTNSIESAKQLELAQQYAEEARAAADSARQDRTDIASLTGTDGTSGSGAAPTINITKSILENAASAVDSYTASLAAASEAAGSTQSVVQFTQNNTSPVALSPSEVYRQTKNLLSTQEVKVG